MTAVLVVLALAAAVGYTHWCWWRAWHRWTDQHNYDRVRLETTRVDLLYREKDHSERLARRWERRALVAREHIGDLTLQLDRARRHHRRSPVPDYGIHRGRAAA